MDRTILCINTRRSGYTPQQCCATLTVGELIAELEGYAEETPVYFRNDDEYTYGEITEEDLRLAADNDQEVRLF